MPVIKIDGQEFNTDSMSALAKKELVTLQAIEGEVRRIQLQLAITSTAREVHIQRLKTALIDPVCGDTIRVS